MVLSKIRDVIFNPAECENQSLKTILVTASIIALYFVGISHWIFFFRAGDMSFGYADWSDDQFYVAIVMIAGISLLISRKQIN